MEISLASRSDIIGWRSFFGIFGCTFLVPVWRIIGIPQDMCDHPAPVSEYSRKFFERGGEITPTERLASADAVQAHLEAARMIDLGHLYQLFGRILANYGLSSTIGAYDWGERHFIHEKTVFWDTWSSIWLRTCNNGSHWTEFLKGSDYSHLVEILKERSKERDRKQKQVEFEIGKLTSTATLNELSCLIEWNLYSSNDNDQPNDLSPHVLEATFNFELILYQEFAYDVWRDLNKLFDRSVRMNIYRFGKSLSGSFGGGIDERLMDYCLSVGNEI